MKITKRSGNHGYNFDTVVLVTWTKNILNDDYSASYRKACQVCSLVREQINQFGGEIVSKVIISTGRWTARSKQKTNQPLTTRRKYSSVYQLSAHPAPACSFSFYRPAAPSHDLQLIAYFCTTVQEAPSWCRPPYQTCRPRDEYFLSLRSHMNRRCPNFSATKMSTATAAAPFRLRIYVEPCPQMRIL